MVTLRRTLALLLLVTGAIVAPSASAATTRAALPCRSTSVLLLSAYPAEIAANLSRLVQDPGQPTDVHGHKFYRGTLLGRRVVMGLSGEGTKNGHDTTLLALRHFSCISAVVFSGTAGGGAHAKLGDVAVPARWTEDGGKTFELVDPALLTGARKIAAEAAAHLATSAPINVGPCGGATPPVVYLARAPTVVLGGTGFTDGSSNPGTCTSSGGALGGCDPCPPTGFTDAPSSPATAATGPAKPLEVPVDELVSNEQETAAAMRAATEVGVPFIAFRAVSDDALPTGDNVPVWLGEYLAYQQLAADNAALVARLWIRDWNGLPSTAAPVRRGSQHSPAHRQPGNAAPTPARTLAATGLPWPSALLAVLFVAAGATLRRLAVQRR